MFTFSKNERLCSQNIIERLYASRLRTLVFPISAHWLFVEENEAPARLQVVIVAPKKKLHHAVDRNRTKRLMRECYRLRKGALIETLEKEHKAMALSLNYIHTDTPDYWKLSASFDKLIAELTKQITPQKNEGELQ
ncbi:MAG: ribonuclease P protein component [Bacteroidales bacterium]|nr:ribonuclease P protein component [Bacteroidales bacterium]